MIRRNNRFHGYNSLRFVYQAGQTVRGQQLSLRYCHNKRRQQFRLAVVVSKKVNKSAVARNRIRRRIYEVVRLLTPQIKDPYDLVITVFHDNIAELNSAELTAKVTDLLSQAHVIINSKEKTL